MDNWVSDFLYPTRSKYNVLSKYRDFFSKIYKNQLVAFEYICILKSGEFFSLSSENELVELFLDVKGYKDSPFFKAHEQTVSGYHLAWPDYSEKNLMHSHFECALSHKFGIDVTFCVSEKYLSHHNSFIFEFKVLDPSVSMDEKKSTVLLDHMNNMHLMNAGLEQLKAEFHPIIRKNDIFRLNLDSLGRNLARNKQALAFQQEKKKITLIAAGLLDRGDLALQQIKLSRQEEFCLDLYLKGKTAKEASRLMKISHRTVESYLDNIKSKLNVFTKSEVLEKAKKLTILRGF